MAEAVVQRCSVKKVFLEISQNSQENACARVSLNKVAPFFFTLNKVDTPFLIEHLWGLLLEWGPGIGEMLTEDISNFF